MVKRNRSTSRLLKMFETTTEGTMKVTWYFLNHSVCAWTKSTKRAHDDISKPRAFITACGNNNANKSAQRAHTQTVLRCEGSHWWLVIAQIPEYLKHYFRLHSRILCYIPARQNKNAFKFGWGIKMLCRFLCISRMHVL